MGSSRLQLLPFGRGFLLVKLPCKQWVKHRLKAAARDLCLFLSSSLSVCARYTHKLKTGSSPLGTMRLSGFAPSEVQLGDAELSKMV